MKGISDIVGMVILLGISIAGIAIVLTASSGFLDEIKERSLFDSAKAQMDRMDRAVSQVSLEGEGSSRVLDVREGEYIIDKEKDEIRFEMESKSKIFPPGSSRREDGLLITAGADVDAYEANVVPDSYKELVLENSRVLFAVKKIGTEGKSEPLDTASLISLLMVKGSGNVTPTDSSFSIDGVEKSSSGAGYTKILQQGKTLGKGTIIVYVNSPKVSYEIWYSLSSGADYVEIEAKNVAYR